MRLIDFTGRKFGRLTVIRRDENAKSKRVKWVCVCKCGVQKSIFASVLSKGRAVSCGCAKAERFYKHGMTDYPEYSIWEGMVQRCTNPRNDSYYLYGGRGITICERWLTFENFFVDMGRKPDGFTLDRIDPNGNYEPSNCRWVDNYHQAINKRMRVDCKSGHTGVSWCSRNSMWRAYINYYKRRIELGYFDDIEDAVAAREEAERKYVKKPAKRSAS